MMNYFILWFFIYLFLGILFYLSGVYFIMNDILILMDWEIISYNSCSVVMTLLFDWISLLFIGSVMIISCMVIYYSNSYMSGDCNNLRFLLLVVMFVISMCFMVISPNLVSILLGWDGLGLVSYCLVIYFQNFKSYSSGMLTVLTNRIGDVAILMSIGICLSSGSWYFIYYNFYSFNWSYMLMVLVILASFTSSAQIPFSSWLPAAMSAPTPVSALVHSSTLVTAGVYLLIRFNNLLYQFDLSFFLTISVLTMFMSGLGANYEYDMKKIIALSTLSQLGLMMSILFMGYPFISFFHLLTHAFFSALLFLCSGLIIHCMNNTQDIRYMGGLVNMLPYTSGCFIISNLSLCGLPFMSGFYSKDLVLEMMDMTYFNLFIFILFYISVGLTACYSVRLIYFSMINYIGLLSYNCYYEDYDMMFSLFLLTIFSVCKGSMLAWLLFNFNLVVLPLLLSVLALLFIFLGVFIGYESSLMGYLNYNLFGFKMSFVFEFFIGMWFLPYFSTYYLSSNVLNMSYNFLMMVESGWGEFLISGLLVSGFIYLSKLNVLYQSHTISVYFILFILMILMMVLIY
uniref:NADH-ubiquinone oxidoreductase chain 5 n=1 Tax=Bryanellocoris orientalis TaxID=2813430 RepID=A0A8T9VZ68_9HEMI|nr:NADH dehydrogenase subunit 5 [Bryanellocoris orientalis]UPI55319.1 NADH dehydrogenase subunit 5 [Bryanellocoris orientalis]